MLFDEKKIGSGLNQELDQQTEDFLPEQELAEGQSIDLATETRSKIDQEADNSREITQSPENSIKSSVELVEKSGDSMATQETAPNGDIIDTESTEYYVNLIQQAGDSPHDVLARLINRSSPENKQ